MPQPEEKPRRLYFKSYLKLIENSVGSNLFRNLYVETSSKGKFDALDDGENSCAFYVSSILVIFKKIAGIHGLVDSVVKDMKQSGWAEVEEAAVGDVLVWEGREYDKIINPHIGFYMGNNTAISNSSRLKTPVKHDMNFGKANRKIIKILRMYDWDDHRSTEPSGPR